MEKLILVAEVFWKIFCNFAPAAAVGALVMWITTRK